MRAATPCWPTRTSCGWGSLSRRRDCSVEGPWGAKLEGTCAGAGEAGGDGVEARPWPVMTVSLRRFVIAAAGEADPQDTLPAASLLPRVPSAHGGTPAGGWRCWTWNAGPSLCVLRARGRIGSGDSGGWKARGQPWTAGGQRAVESTWDASLNTNTNTAVERGDRSRVKVKGRGSPGPRPL